MKRRAFLRNVTVGSAAGLSAFAIMANCTKDNARTAKGNPEAAEPFELAEFTIEGLQQKMTSGELTARAIAELYIKRIQAIDHAGPKLRSVIELNDDALSIADLLDTERKNGVVRGPLHGIPVLVKDNIDTGDKMMTTAGSLALSGNVAIKDAFIIAQLRKAGAVLLGKTNLSEWANFRSTRSSSGWSSRGGQTKNPYVLDRSPCGSSSGSGTAVAANLCAVAIGTETNGSIACPSSTNGIVGIKPTVGLWSRSGIIPISATQDTAGPMARTVKDAALFLGALTAIDASDPASAARNASIPSDYSIFLRPEGLDGKVIGVERTFMKGHEAIDRLLQKALSKLREKGAIIVEVDLVDKLKPLEEAEFELLKFEFKDGLNRYLENARAPVKSLKDVIEFNQKNESTVMPFFKQEILIDSEMKEGLGSEKYKTIYTNLIDGTRNTINELFQKNKLDALCGPTNGPSWCIDLVNGDFFTGYGMYSPAAVAGYPSITVPMGTVLGLPVGISFIGLAFYEPQLLEIAYSYEQASLHRISPQFKADFS